MYVENVYAFQGLAISWRFEDGKLIKVIGDLCWWTLLKTFVGLELKRLDVVISNYNSHPEYQAEFREKTTMK